jgi:hypothetical protein
MRGSYSTTLSNDFIGNLFHSALTAGFPLNRVAGMTSRLLGMNQHNLKQAEIFTRFPVTHP